MLSHKDCIFYLRALYYLFLNRFLDSFKDFYSIESLNLFPKQLIQDEIYPVLSPNQKEYLKEQDFYKKSSQYKKIYEEHNNKFLASLTSVDLISNEYDIIEDLSRIFFYF